MAIRRIVVQGDSVLNKKCRQVTDFNKRLHQLLDDMKDTLAEAQGAGLAAPQVGILRRAVIVVNDEDEVMELVNPEIIFQEGEQTEPEGCLSVPGKWGMVTRPDHVRVRYQDRFGNWMEADGVGLTARCFCHEIDHLEGKVFTSQCERMLTREEIESGEF